MKKAGYDSLAVLGAGAGFLVARQNGDHGWGFNAGDPSRVFPTAHVVMALQALRTEFSVDTQIQNGVTYIKSQKHLDGGFGTGVASNTYETTLALLAIEAEDPLAPEVLSGQVYLLGTQLPDGSWGDDSYSTALAALALPSETITAVPEGGESIPSRLFCCSMISPFTQTTSVRYSVPALGRVSVTVFNISSRRVRQLVDATQARGWHDVVWDGTTDTGRRSASGIYIVQVRTSGESSTGKLVMTR